MNRVESCRNIVAPEKGYWGNHTPIHLISSDDSALLGAARCYLERVF
ncbi:MAG: hypothetical protein AB2807_05840 [Candidatus Sedimenticola endophacoides]